MGRHKRQLDALERDFERHLKTQGLATQSVYNYVSMARQFLRHVGETRIDRISEDTARSFFAGIKGEQSRKQYANAVSQFLRFSAARLPVVVNARGAESPRAPTKKEIALRQRWSVDKLVEQKSNDDDLIAKLARKVIDHYLYFQGRMKGQPENLDDIYRFADECKELIESNLALFMSLSAQGRNIHSAIDERVQR